MQDGGGIFGGSIFSGMGDDAAPTITAVTQLRPITLTPLPAPSSDAAPADGMSTMTKVAIGVAGVGVLGALGWFIWKRRQVKTNRRRRR